ncbi:MAG: hypothetical protein FWG38_03060 [Defluviitaleaceae bacterium]|nr:hypothetical protein [Defluviitaleaceae bacterium]
MDEKSDTKPLGITSCIVVAYGFAAIIASIASFFFVMWDTDQTIRAGYAHPMIVLVFFMIIVLTIFAVIGNVFVIVSGLTGLNYAKDPTHRRRKATMALAIICMVVIHIPGGFAIYFAMGSLPLFQRIPPLRFIYPILSFVLSSLFLVAVRATSATAPTEQPTHPNNDLQT